MSDPGDFVDLCLQREASWARAEEAKARLGSTLDFYGASVGAVRGTIRDLARRHRNLSHDDITALSSELWAVPVFERRLAAIVLLQSNVGLLDNSDLTRIEGFLREARLRALVDPLAVDVTGPLVAQLEVQARSRAEVVLERWVRDPDKWLRRAVLMSPVRELRAGGGDWDTFVRRARTALADFAEHGHGDGVVREAVAYVVEEVGKKRPGLSFPASASIPGY